MNTQTPHFPRTPARIEAGLLSTLPAVSPAVKPLSKEEQKDFAAFDEKIQAGLQTAGKIFQEIGEYLEEIRSRRLYRQQYASWEDYCRQRWNRSTAWALMQRRSAGVIKALKDASATESGNPNTENRSASAGLRRDENPNLESSPGTANAGAANLAVAPAIAPAGGRQAGPPILPTNESQVRALAPLPQEKAVEAWNKAKEIAGAGKQPTAAHVREAVKGGKEWPKPNQHGVYDEKKARRQAINASHCSAAIEALQIGEREWIRATEYSFHGTSVGCGGLSGPLSRQAGVFASEEEAVMNGAAQLEDSIQGKLKGNCTAAQKAQAKQLLGWVWQIWLQMAERTRSRCSDEEFGVPLTRTRPSEQFSKVRVAEVLPAGERNRKGVLEAAQRAVVAIRALQDLVAGDVHEAGYCNLAVRQIEMLEHRVKHGKEVPTSVELKWSVQDSAADLGGLEEMLDGSEHSTLSYCAQIALAALKPLFDKLKIGNMRVDRNAAIFTDPRKALAGVPGPRKAAERQEAFVICREPMKNAIGVARKARYLGNPGGWTPDPDKVTPFKTFREAQEIAGDTDRVVPLVKAQRRFAQGL